MKKILLVEDDLFLVKVYKALLEKEGYSVDILNNGKEVLEKVQTNPPDLIVLDLIMPERDGFAVLEELEKDQEGDKIPVYVLTVLSTDEDKEKVKKLGADRHIVKTDKSFKDIVVEIKKNFPL